MKIKAISDLHIGDRSAADDFEIDELIFLEYLEKTLEEYDKLILCGDVVECWQSSEWNIQRETFMEIMLKRHTLFEYLLKKMISQQIIYVVGNHDTIVLLKELLAGVHEKYEIEAHGVRLLFAHGHQADIFNSTFADIGHGFAKAMGWMQKNIHRHIDNYVRELQQFVPGRHANPEIFFEHARNLAIDNAYDIVVYGHTHRPTVIPCEQPKFTYANTGKVCDYVNNSWDELLIHIYSDGTFDIRNHKADVLGL